MKKNLKKIFKKIKKKLVRRNYLEYRKRDIRIHPLSQISKNVYIGDHTNINNPSVINGGKKGCFIGKWCAIAGELLVIPTNHRYDYPNMQAKLQNRFGFSKVVGLSENPIHIGNAVWIGRRVTILPDVKIGDGSVIGACSVVTKDIPPFAVAVGVPAKVVKYRFNKKMIDKLLEIKWWDWDEMKIKKNKKFFNQNLKNISPEELDRIIK